MMACKRESTLQAIFYSKQAERNSFRPARSNNMSDTPGGSKIVSISGNDPNMKMDAWWGLVIAVVVLLVAMMVFSPTPYWDLFQFISDGIATTVFITIVSFLLILVLGLVGALGRMSKNRVIAGIAGLYVELIRGIPLMVQLIWWYYAFPVIIADLGQRLGLGFLSNYQANANVMAVVGLTVCYGAYMTEIYRAGIQSIAKGQMEAARSLGMNYFQAMRYVILPQAVRVILPPVGNEFVALLKDSSLVSVVAVVDITRRGREFMSTHFNPIETWSFVALVYLVMTLLSARVVNRIEQSSKMER
jgi:polar amino acid transport system permease protein